MKVRLTAEAVLEVSKEDLKALQRGGPYTITRVILAHEGSVKAQVRVVGGRRLWLWRKT